MKKMIALLAIAMLTGCGSIKIVDNHPGESVYEMVQREKRERAALGINIQCRNSDTLQAFGRSMECR